MTTNRRTQIRSWLTIGLWLTVWVGMQVICTPAPSLAATETVSQAVDKKKVLFINSYDLDSPWALGTLRGALAVFAVKLDDQFNLDDAKSPVRFKLFNMNTKKHKSIVDKKKAALAAKALIESWQPDVVICADDNASKYVIVPYFKDAEIPFVFCGVNWSAAEYGLPCSNVTGMIEVFPIQEALNIIRPHARGERVGFISNDTLSEHKNAQYIKDLFKLDLTERYVTSMAEFEQAYQEIQAVNDILIVIEVGSLKDFDEEKYLAITERHISVPTISFSHQHYDKYLLTCKRVPEEQGQWAAHAALQILNGKPPSDIPIAMNVKAAIRLNMKLAKKLGIKFPMDVIQRSSFVVEETQK